MERIAIPAAPLTADSNRLGACCCVSVSGQFRPAADGFPGLAHNIFVADTALCPATGPVLGMLAGPQTSTGRCRNMKKTERVRQVVSGALGEEDLKQQAEKGWKLVAVEWEREVEVAEGGLQGDVPYGLQIAPQTQRLEENPSEREILVQLLELLVQEGSYARIADEINRRGLRTREGARWTAVSVFEMLPRLIEVGPHVFRSAEWQKRRQLSARAH